MCKLRPMTITSPRVDDPRYVRSRRRLLAAVVAAYDDLDAGSRSGPGTLTGAAPSLAALSVSEVARRAGVSRPTFYQHFTDVPQAAAAAALERLAEAFAAIPQTAVGEGWTAFTHRTLRGLLMAFEGHSHFHAAVFAQSTAPVAAAAVSAIADRLLDSSPLGPVLRRRPGADAPRERAEFLAAGVLWHVLTWLCAPSDARADLDDSVAHLSDLLLGASGATPAELAAVRAEQPLAGVPTPLGAGAQQVRS